MRVRRRAAAKKAQTFEGGDLMPRTWRDEDRITGEDRTGLTINLHRAFAFEKEIKLLA